MANHKQAFQLHYAQKSMLRLYKKIEYLKDLMHLVESELIDSLEQKKTRLNEKIARSTENLKLKTLPLEDYVAQMSEQKIIKLEKTYDLKKKALNQTWIRNHKDLDDPILKDQMIKLDQKKALRIKQLNERYENSYHKSVHLTQEGYQSELEKLENSKKEKFALWEEKNTQKRVKQKKILNQKIQRLETLYQQKKEQTQGVDQTHTLDSDVVLDVKDLTMKFGGLTAVDNLSFSIKEGEVFGLIGPNGAGKTTVFNCITQFYKPDQGDIMFKDLTQNVISLNHYKVHQVIGHGIARTFQNIELIWELSILDNLLIGAHSMYQSGFFSHLFHTTKFRREERVLKKKAEKILTDLGIGHYMHFYPIGLPYGVLKTIEFARTLMTNPKLIILDEPAAGLNDSETEFLAKTIKKVQKEYNTTIFLVEHDMNLVMSICDTVCAISFGKKLALGKPKEIQNNALVQEAYLGGE